MQSARRLVFRLIRGQSTVLLVVCRRWCCIAHATQTPLAPRSVQGQRAGRPHRAACSLAQMVLQHTMGLA